MAKTPSKKSAKTAKAAGPKKHKKRTEVSCFSLAPFFGFRGWSKRALFALRRVPRARATPPPGAHTAGCAARACAPPREVAA